MTEDQKSMPGGTERRENPAGDVCAALLKTVVDLRVGPNATAEEREDEREVVLAAQRRITDSVLQQVRERRLTRQRRHA